MIRIDKKTYPNGQDYKVIAVFNQPTDKWNTHTIGSYTIETTGFLPSGSRKIVKNENEAIEIVCKKYVKKHLDFIREIADFLASKEI